MVRDSGGRRGEAQTRTATGGLVWATSRHATTRAGDPQVHDHVLIANVVWMRDERGGWKALDTAFVRDHLRAATAVGRLAAARKAAELGYGIDLDFGRSERLGGWQIAGLPRAALDVLSKRSREIDEKTGPGASYAARNFAARQVRAAKTPEPVGDMVRRWRSELVAAGFDPDRLLDGVRDATHGRSQAWEPVGVERLGTIVTETLDLGGPLTEEKVFDRTDVVVAVAPHLYGHPVEDPDRAVDAVIADSRCVPLLGVEGARSQAYATAAVLAAETRIAELAEALAGQPAARLDPSQALATIGAHTAELGVALNDGQRRAAEALLTSGAGLDLLVGVAGSGKTTSLAVVRAGFEARLHGARHGDERAGRPRPGRGRRHRRVPHPRVAHLAAGACQAYPHRPPRPGSRRSRDDQRHRPRPCAGRRPAGGGEGHRCRRRPPTRRRRPRRTLAALLLRHPERVVRLEVLARMRRRAHEAGRDRPSAHRLPRCAPRDGAPGPWSVLGPKPQVRNCRILYHDACRKGGVRRGHRVIALRPGDRAASLCGDAADEDEARVGGRRGDRTERVGGRPQPPNGWWRSPRPPPRRAPGRARRAAN